jgi:hypothetical protein
MNESVVVAALSSRPLSARPEESRHLWAIVLAGGDVLLLEPTDGAAAARGG